MRPAVRVETVAGATWTDGRVTVTPLAKRVTLAAVSSHSAQRAADSAAGAAWLFSASRPAAVLVSADGRASRLSIIDLTRWAQVAIVIAATIVLCQTWTRTKKRKERSWIAQ